jgi:hypothetical protein
MWRWIATMADSLVGWQANWQANWQADSMVHSWVRLVQTQLSQQVAP